ncbi:MAG: hypothetical protein AAGA92_00995 [Planctomycetota bacterium]
MRYSRAATCCLVVLACLTAEPLVSRADAEEESHSNTAPPVPRLFVPADALESVLPLTGPLVDIGQEDYLLLLHGDSRGVGSQSAVWISSAAHQIEEQPARHRLAGVSRLQLERLPSAKTNSVLRLAPMDVQVESAAWVDRPEEPVALGYWNSAAGGAVFGVAVPRPGVLEITWSASSKPFRQAHRNPSVEYVFSLPLATKAVLDLKLPEGREADLSDAAQRPTDQDQATPQALRYTLAPADAYRLRVTEKRDPARRPACRWSCHSRFSVDRGGIHGEHVVRFRRDEPIDGAIDLSLRGDAVLTAVEQSSDGAQAERMPHGPTSVKLALLAGSPGTIVCRTLSPLVLGRPFELPAIRVSSGEWTEGSTELELDSGLRLIDLQAEDASITAEPRSPAEGGAGRAASATHHSPSARLKVVIHQQRRAFAARSVSRIDLGSIESSGALATELVVESGPIFQIEGVLTTEWEIESVETEPPERLRSWQRRDGRLSVALSEPLTGGDRLVVRADGRLPAAAELASPTARELRLCEWQDDTNRSHALLVDRDLELLPDRGAALDGALLSDESYAESFGAVEAMSLGQQAIELSVLGPDQRVSLGAAPPVFSVESVLQIDCGDEFRYRYRCEATPQRGSLSALVFRFQRPLPEGARFFLESDGERIEAPPTVSEYAEDEAVYTLSIPADLPAPYVLHIECEEVAETHASCNAIRFPRAAMQQSWLAVRAPPGRVSVRPGGAVAAPLPGAEQPEPADTLPLVAAYRLPPRRFWGPRTLPMVLPQEGSAGSSEAGQPSSDDSEHHVVYLADGRAIHEVEFRTNSLAPWSAGYPLPPNASNAWVQASGEARRLLAPSQRTSAIEASLLRGESPGRVRVGFETELLREWGGVTTTPAEAAGVATLGKRRVVAWAPPGYRACLSSTGPDGTSVWSRIAGPFGVVRNQTAGPAGSGRQRPAFPGWTPYRFDLVGGPEPITFYRVAEAFEPSWVLGLAAATGVTVVLRRATRARAVLICIATAAVVLGPPGWLWLAHPLFAGAILGAVCACWVGRAGRASQAAEGVHSSAPAACLFVFALLATAESRSAMAADATPNVDPAPSVVVLPFDRTDYQLGNPLASETAIRLLAEIADPRAESRLGFVIVNAEYRGDAQTGDWRCVWDIDCRNSSGRVELAIRREEAQWSATAQVAGIRQPVQWNAGGDRCQFNLPGLGRYRVELPCRFDHERDGTYGRLSLAVPRAAKAIVRVVGLKPGAHVQCVTTNAFSRADAEGLASLRTGHTDRLDLLLSNPPNATADEQTNSRAALCWLRIGRDRVRLKVFDSTSEAGEGPAFPKLRTPVPYREVPNGSATDTGAVRAFEADRSGGIGRIYQPQIDWGGAPEPDIQWAVTVEPGLAYSLRLRPGAQETDPAAFASAWPSKPSEPDAAFVSRDADRPWRIDVREQPVEFLAEQRVSLNFDRSSVGVDYSAAITAVEGRIALHRLEVHPSFELRAAWAVTDESEEPISLRTTRPSTGRLIVFLPKRVGGPHTIRLEGRAPLEDGLMPLPGVALEGSPPGTYRLSLEHARAVRLDVSEVAVPIELTAAVATAGDEPIPAGDARWSPESVSNPGSVKLSEYGARFQVSTAVQWLEKEASRRLVLDGLVEAADGPVEWITCELPESWLNARIAWDGASKTEPLPRGRTILLRLPEPLTPGGALPFRLSAEAKIDAPSAEDVLVRFPDAAEERAFVRVSPGQVMLKRLASADGSQTPLPPGLLGSDESSHDVLAYRLDAGAPRGKAVSAENLHTIAEIGPTLVEAVVDSTGATLARARVLVASGASEGLELRLPDEASLLRLEVGGVRAPRSADWTTRVRVEVQPPGVPRLVEAWYGLPREASELHAPRWYQDQSLIGDGGFYWRVSPARGRSILLTDPAAIPESLALASEFETDWIASAEQDAARQLLLESEWDAWLRETRAPGWADKSHGPFGAPADQRLSFTTSEPVADLPAKPSAGGASSERVLLLLLLATGAWGHARYRWTDALLAALFLPALLAVTVAALIALPLSTAEALLAAGAVACIAVQLAAAGLPQHRADPANGSATPAPSGAVQGRV